MRKIPTLFQRDPDDRKHVLPQVNPDAEWVINGEGIATRKYDGTCVKLDGERWWARREVKAAKPPPHGFEFEQRDAVTGKTVGWEPFEQSAFSRYLREAIEREPRTEPGSYELCGPKVNGNPEGFPHHVLVRHGALVLQAPRDYDGLRDWLGSHEGEGIVWHHPDGRMAKIKRRDFPGLTSN